MMDGSFEGIGAVHGTATALEVIDEHIARKPKNLENPALSLASQAKNI
jgi:hypothetical protein